MILRNIDIKITGSALVNSWYLKDLYLEGKTLLVGQNGTGKSRCLSFIWAISQILIQNIPPKSDRELTYEYNLEFEDENISHVYYLNFSQEGVQKETFQSGNKILLDREIGKCELWNSIEAKFNTIHPPIDKLVSNVRRDVIEYPFLEKLIQWAESLFLFKFAVDNSSSDFSGKLSELSKLNQVADVYSLLEPESKMLVLKAFNELGYHLRGIAIASLPVSKKNQNILHFTEQGLPVSFQQSQISQGMFRAFSLIVLIQYFIDQKKDALILIDDLAEGLDYERSTLLAKVLLQMLDEQPHVRLIATSNDSYLMDAFEMEYWNILKREGGEIKTYNYHNSKEKFDKFRFTGLGNFNLFSSDFLN